MADTTRMYGMDAKDSTIYCAVLFVGWDRVSGPCVPVGTEEPDTSVPEWKEDFMVQNVFDKLENAFSRYKVNETHAYTTADNSKQADYSSSMNMLKVAVQDFLDPTAGMTDAQRERFVKKLYAKIQSGKKLTADEMAYLRKYDPVTYMKVARIQAQREALEAQLKSCKSKEEVQKVYTDAVIRVPEDDPAREELMAAYADAYDEFKKSDDYGSLPQKDDDRDKKAGTGG